jgi:GNAT superfamily N-acetyltransferase
VAPTYVFARVTPDDAGELAATVAAGFDFYRGFAPPGWNPPKEIASPTATRARLVAPDMWGLLARTPSGQPVGHVGFFSSKTSRWSDNGDDLAHLWQLFVREPFWGRGVAATLLGRATDAAARQGYARMRLFTPAGQARARRFYEREGWSARGEPIDAELGIPLVEYRRPLGRA